MKFTLKTKLIKYTLVLTVLILTGCTSKTWHNTVKPSTPSSSLAATTTNADTANRVGITTLPVPGNIEYKSIQSSNYIQAFLDMGLDARETSFGFVIFLPSTGHFDTNKALVKPAIESIIPRIVAEANKGYLSTHEIQVAGHTDTPGSLNYNQTLSNRRANEVMNDMIESGLSSQRISMLGFGESLPLYNQHTHLNRRTDLIFHKP